MDKTSPQNRTPLRRPVRKISQQQEERKQRIGKMMGWMLIITALSVDLIEILLEWLGIGLVINVTTTPAFALLFWIWFQLLGVKYTANTKRFGVSALTVIIELIPGFDATLILSFMWTFGMAIIVGMVRMEDKGENPTILGGLAEVLTSSSIIDVVPDVVTRRFKKIGEKMEKPMRRFATAKNITSIATKQGRMGENQTSLKTNSTNNNVLNLKKKEPTQIKTPLKKAA